MMHDKIAKMTARGPEVWNELLHPDYEFVRHRGDPMNKEQTLEMMGRLMASDAVQATVAAASTKTTTSS